MVKDYKLCDEYNDMEITFRVLSSQEVGNTGPFKRKNLNRKPRIEL